MAFNWGNLSKGLSKELARSARLRVSFAVEDLSAKYGELPTDVAVDDLWPTLRERWLATRPASRERAVYELRNVGLGDTSIKISTKTGQMEYLRSCRLSSRLKAIVLATFLDEGSQPMMAPSVMVDSPPTAKPPEPNVKDTFGAVRQALAEMDIRRVVALELTLRNLMVNFVQKYRPLNPATTQRNAHKLAENLIVALTESIAAKADPSVPDAPYREKIVAGAHRLASQNGPDDLLAAFIRFGAQMLVDPTNDAGAVASRSVTTALAMIASEDLAPNAELYAEVLSGSMWLWTSLVKSNETLTNAILRPVEVQTTPWITPPDQPTPPSLAELKSHVSDILIELMGHPPIFDEDGDIPIGRGSAQIFLRIIENDVPVPMLRIFGGLVRGVRSTPELLGDLNEANQNFLLCRLVHVDEAVFLDGYIPAINLSIHELALFLEETQDVADHFDTMFAGRHGGTTASPDLGEVVDV